MKKTLTATVLCALVSVLTLGGCDLNVSVETPSAPAPTPTTEATPTPDPLPNDPPVESTIPEIDEKAPPSLPTGKIKVNAGDLGSVASVQAFADDVAAGDVEKIVTWCWTRSPDEIRRVFGSPNYRGAVLEALSHPGQGVTAGAYWEGDYLSLRFFHEEFNSRYACPHTEFTPSEASWRIKRILAVHDGKPVHAGDGENYWLLCDQDCGHIWDTNHLTYLDPVESRKSPISTASKAQWDRLRTLSKARLSVEVLNDGHYYRVRAADGSTTAVAYFTASWSSNSLPYLLGEVT